MIKQIKNFSPQKKIFFSSKTAKMKLSLYDFSIVKATAQIDE
jgi:hypothetical protein